MEPKFEEDVDPSSSFQVKIEEETKSDQNMGERKQLYNKPKSTIKKSRAPKNVVHKKWKKGTYGLQGRPRLKEAGPPGRPRKVCGCQTWEDFFRSQLRLVKVSLGKVKPLIEKKSREIQRLKQNENRAKLQELELRKLSLSKTSTTETTLSTLDRRLFRQLREYLVSCGKFDFALELDWSQSDDDVSLQYSD